jgi:seryl-tRNA synthetase
MRRRERIVRALRERGELWEPVPGAVGLRGGALRRFRDVERRIASLCARVTEDDWRVPAALPLEALERASYFASFPQWLTLASHLTDDAGALERIASSSAPAAAAAANAAPAGAALPPAVCYHVYAALAGAVVDAPRLVTAQGCCWRHEGERHEPLARGWAFTMREVVCIGSEAACLRFRDAGIAAARALAAELGLPATLEAAEDPFFAPTGRGRALLQRLKELKQELRLDAGDGETVAAASFNLHERHFGEAFDIRLADGTPAYSACVAFGIERWLLASLVAADAHAAGAPVTEEAIA